MITPDEAGARIAATWAFSELAWSELMDDDQISFQTEATGLVTEIRNGQQIPYNRNPGDRPIHVCAVIEHMAKLKISTWSGTGKELKAIVATGPAAVHSVSPTLAESLSRGEASARAEGVDVAADPAYQIVKEKMLSGEINSDEAVALYFETRGDLEPVKGFGLWKDKPVDGLEYQERIREEWER